MASEIGTCRLCLQDEVALRDSHFVPKFMYKILREETKQNPNPVHITVDEAKQTSWQVTAKVLCDECEDRLNRGGESYVAKVCYRDEQNFTLRNELRTTNSIGSLHDGKLQAFLKEDLPGIDSARIAYFGASILWRCGVWSGIKPELFDIPVEDEVQESVRRFLMGDSEFPASVRLLLTVLDEPTEEAPLNFSEFISFPYGELRGDSGMVRFLTLGLSFQLDIKEEMSEAEIDASFYPGSIIYLSNWTSVGTCKEILNLAKESSLNKR